MSIAGRGRNDGRVGSLLRGLDDNEPPMANKKGRRKRPSTRNFVCGGVTLSTFSSDDSQEEMCGAMGSLTLSATSWKSEEASAFSDLMNRYDEQQTAETASLAYSDSNAEDLGGSDRLSVKAMVAQIEHHSSSEIVPACSDREVRQRYSSERISPDLDQPINSLSPQLDSTTKKSIPQHLQEDDPYRDIPDSFEQLLSDCRTMAEDSHLMKTNNTPNKCRLTHHSHPKKGTEDYERGSTVSGVSLPASDLVGADVLSPSSSVFSKTVDFFRKHSRSRRCSVGSPTSSSVFSNHIKPDLVQDFELRDMLVKTQNGNNVSDFFPSMPKDIRTSSFSDDGMDAELGALTSINDELRREIQKFETKAYLKSSSLSELMEEEKPAEEPIEIIQVHSNLSQNKIHEIHVDGKKEVIHNKISAPGPHQPASPERHAEENSLGTFSTYPATDQSSPTHNIIHIHDEPLGSRTSIGSIDENELARMIADEDVQAVDLIREALRYELSEMVQNQVLDKHQKIRTGTGRSESDKENNIPVGVLNEEELAALAANTDVPAKDVIREILRKELAVVIHDEIQKRHDAISLVDPEGSRSKEIDVYPKSPLLERPNLFAKNRPLGPQDENQKDGTREISSNEKGRNKNSQAKPSQKNNKGEEDIEIIHIVESMSDDQVQQKYGSGIKTTASNTAKLQKENTIHIDGSLVRPVTGIDLTQPRHHSLTKTDPKPATHIPDAPPVNLGLYDAEAPFQLSSLTDIPSVDTESLTSRSEPEHQQSNSQKSNDPKIDPQLTGSKLYSNTVHEAGLHMVPDHAPTQALLEEVNTYCKQRQHESLSTSNEVFTETDKHCTPDPFKRVEDSLEPNRHLNPNQSQSSGRENAVRRKSDMQPTGEKRLIQVNKFLSFEKQVGSESENDNAGIDATPKVKNTRGNEDQDFHDNHQEVACVESGEPAQKAEESNPSIPYMGNLPGILKSSFTSSGKSESTKKKSSIIQRMMHWDKASQASNSRDQERFSVPSVVVGKLMQLTNYAIVENETDITDLTGSYSVESAQTDPHTMAEEGKHVRFSESTQFDAESTDPEGERRWTLEHVYGKLEDAFDTFAFSCGQKIGKRSSGVYVFDEAEEAYQPYQTGPVCFSSHCGSSKRESQGSSIRLEDEGIYSTKVPSKKS